MPCGIIIGNAETRTLNTLILIIWRRPVEIGMRDGTIGRLRQPADLHDLLFGADIGYRHSGQPHHQRQYWPPVTDPRQTLPPRWLFQRLEIGDHVVALRLILDTAKENLGCRDRPARIGLIEIES